jgi:hypothetical protein
MLIQASPITGNKMAKPEIFIQELSFHPGIFIQFDIQE